MSRRTLRGAVPATDSIMGSTITRDHDSTATGTPVDTDAILLRGAEAARARPLDLVGINDESELGAVGPWAEQLDAEREAARTSGFQQGRQEGLAAGLQAAKHQCQTQGEALSSAITSVVEKVDARSEAVGQQLAAQVTELAIGVARAVLDREIAASDDPGAEAIARCLDLVPDTGALVVHLNPDDAAALGEVPGIGDRGLTVVADGTLSPGDAIVTVDQITIDARLSESLRRVEEALR